MDSAHALHDEIFGARAHDPAFWEAHPLVMRSEVHFDGEFGWVSLTTRTVGDIDRPSVIASFVKAEATREGPDLYFWGESECPVALFEHAPRLRELRIAVEGPVEGDARTCWSAGLWLAPDVR
jgi:hypothetical protein